MAFTTTDLSAVESAIATGEMTVEIDGKRVTYRSIPELLKARDIISTALQSSGAIAKQTRTSYVTRTRD